LIAAGSGLTEFNAKAQRFFRQWPLDFVAQVSKPAVSPTSKSARPTAAIPAAGLETRDTADLEVRATLVAAEAGC
jgi:hypothetical protein